ncbi:hypothetical protein KKH23_06515 [Patescibacteria group bacterium]|uniref:Uncharacterized protein n=1 Tax=viral metagenome TaxID=1070528 RepID=A0A6M3MCQ3_9ZZZZ|nr:hypothetical protein [Patescibacteria group bacterium]
MSEDILAKKPKYGSQDEETTPNEVERLVKEAYENWVTRDLKPYIEELLKKFDVIRAHLDAVPCDDADFFKWDISTISFNELMKNLYAALPPKEEKP